MSKLIYEHLPKQELFMQNCNRVPFSAYIGGFGSGKTHVLTLQGLLESGICSRGLIGAPTYKMLEDTTQQKFFDLCPSSWIYSFHGQKNRLKLVNGTEILFRSLENPGRLSGLELDWFGLDEIGLVKEDTFKMLQGRLRRPGGRHKGFGVGNPAGPTHWTYSYFVLRAGEFPDDYSLVQATSYENLYNPGSYTRNMEVSFGKETAYYRQYVLGQFVAFEGAYWVNFIPAPYPHGHVLEVPQVSAMLKGPLKFGRAIDFGFEHPFCCLWWVTDGDRFIVFDEYHMKHGLIRHHVEQIREHERQHQHWFGAHNISQTWTDHEAVSRAEISACKDDEGNRIGFDCTPSEKVVMESILLVQSLFGLGRLFITKNCRQTLREIPSYRARAGIAGEEPVKEDDDTCCCLRYATYMEMREFGPWQRWDSASVIPEDLHELAPVEF